MNIRFGLMAVTLAATGFTNTVSAALPDPGVEIVAGRTALVITDPQNDFLSPKDVTWGGFEFQAVLILIMLYFVFTGNQTSELRSATIAQNG